MLNVDDGPVLSLLNSPVDLTVVVTSVVKGLTQTHYGAVMTMGDAVALTVVGTDIELVVITVSTAMQQHSLMIRTALVLVPSAATSIRFYAAGSATA